MLTQADDQGGDCELSSKPGACASGGQQAGTGLLRLGRREAVHPALHDHMPGGAAHPDTSVAGLRALASTPMVVSPVTLDLNSLMHAQ